MRFGVLYCLARWVRSCPIRISLGRSCDFKTFDNCRTEDIYIRYSYISASSGFIGNIGDGGINISWSAALEINNCSPASNVRYINDRDGGINTSYQPQSPYYGHKNNVDKVTITPEP